ncbi:hypothetical protein BGX27_005831 [Mortierella sp. AM989]|nr:hypothetical protein BGX27_005831 [Mortierella sp. AM989]
MEQSPSSSSSNTTTTRTRTPSVSATAAIVHSPLSHLQQHSVEKQLENTAPFHMHPWSTERAKIAAESEISPPISPKQHAAIVGGPQADEFLEPLQEANHSSHDRHERLASINNNNNKPSLLNQQIYQRQLSTSITHITSLEPISTGLLLTCNDSSTSSSGSFSSSPSSSASSSSTSLSSYTSVSHSLSTDHHAHFASSTLQKLEIQPTNLYLIDTPPSSHVTSPSSPPFPATKESLPLNSTTELVSLNSNDTKTFIAAPVQKSRAPYHCTKKSVPQIIREISDLVDGRDKTIKVIQYFAKVFLWVFLSDPKQYKLFATRLKALAKQFSTTRKVLRLGHFVDPLASVLTLAATLRGHLQKHGIRGTLAKSPSESWRDTTRDRLGNLNTVFGFVQDIADDICCLGGIGVLDRSFADKAEPWSNRLWMMGVSIDLHENLQSIRDVKKQIQALEMKALHHKSEEEEKAWTAQHVKLTTKLHWLKVTTVKLGGDFLFCAYDNLHCSFSDGFQAVTGFASGIAGAYKFVGKIMES